MAVLDKNKMNRTSDTTESTSTGEGKGRVVDLLQDKSLPDGDIRKLDPTEDAWEYGAPPKPRRLSIKCFLAKDGQTCYDQDKTKPVGYGFALECKVVNSGDADGVTMFPRVSTFIARGKNLSTAAGLIGKFGYKVPQEATSKAIGILLLQALKKEPVTDIEMDWEGYSKLEKRVVYKGMLAFPHDENGEPLHVVDYVIPGGPHKGETETIRAQPVVVHWYGKGEASKTGKGPVAVPKKEPVTLAPVEEEGEAEGKANAASAGNGDDDLQLLEE